MAPEREQLNVLVIDDDEEMRRLLVDIINREGHQAVPASCAEDGLGLLPLWTFQLAFIDHNLPGIDGLLFGEYLRRNNRDMHIALVTGEQSGRLERRTREMAMTFIRKPFRVEEIVRAIEACLSGAAERRERRLRREDPDYAPIIGPHLPELAVAFGIPAVPQRIEDRLVETIRTSLANLRSVSRYSERDRVVALAGLLTAEVLGLSLPHTSTGRTLFEEYDEMMRQHGRRTEFGPPERRSIEP